MGLNLPPFADAEEVVRALLAPLGVQVVKATPPTIVPPLIMIRHIGGTSDYVTAFPHVMISAIGATRAASMALQLQIQAVIENAFATEAVLPDNSVVLIDGTAVLTAGHPEIYENVDIREAAAVYEIKMRRPVVAPH